MCCLKIQQLKDESAPFFHFFSEKRDKNKLSKTDIIKENILASIRKNGYISTTEIARNLNISLRSVAYYIKDLKGEGKLLRIGGKKGGFWQCVD